jgi:hypothetical protein
MQLEKKYNSILFIGVLFFCFFVSVGVRYQQFETWKTNPSAFFVGERPMMTTLDAPFWLRGAREYNEGTYAQKGALGNYPKNTEIFRDRSIPQNFRDSSKKKFYFIILFSTLLIGSQGNIYP